MAGDAVETPSGSSGSLQTVLSSITLLTAYAYTLGWLKNLYYFKTFGIGLEALQLSTQDHIVQSWFVIENAVFFLILFWTAIKVQRWFVWAVFAIYFMLPIACHYAFLLTDHRTAAWLIYHRHTILKFVPFVVLGILLAANKRLRATLTNLTWPHNQFWLVVFVIVFLAWSVSAAKHFGSFDANLQLLCPDRQLPRAKLHVAKSASELLALDSGSGLYMIHAGPTRIFLLDRTGCPCGQPCQHLHIVIIPADRVEWIELRQEQQVQPGGMYL